MFLFFLLECLLGRSHQRCSVKKGVFRNFAKFIGKHLCQRLFFTEHIWTTSSVYSCIDFLKSLRYHFAPETENKDVKEGGRAVFVDKRVYMEKKNLQDLVLLLF